MKIEEAHLQPIRKILADLVPNYEVLAFGSRVHLGNLKKFSDLDLAIKAPNGLTLDELVSLKEAFSESDLPFKVDIVDWKSCSIEFKEIIMKNSFVLQKAN